MTKGQKAYKGLVGPIQRFFQIEAAGGIMLLLFTIAALIWANSDYGDFYYHFWERELTIGLPNFYISKTLLHWINDGFMAIFFFVVGLEIKRELLIGELSSVKKASLPIFAAIGGMLVPAVMYIILNVPAESEGGWGIPMATDIAFSLGVLSLLGKRVPLSLKVFLVAFAIVDDIGAVIIIALFYSGDIEWMYILVALGFFIMLIIFNRSNVRSIHAYMVVGWIIWYLFTKSGIHPTIAGVMIAFTIPINRRINIATFRRRMDKNLKHFDAGDHHPHTLSHKQLIALDNLENEMRHVQSPVQSLEHKLHGFVTFIVMPLFALTNAGVIFQASSVQDFFGDLSGTIEISLIVGKVLGILVFSWIGVKLGISSLPKKVKWVHVLGLGFIGGMGFTMSLFISNLAFSKASLLDPAKIGILMGSLIAGVLGYSVLRLTLKKNVE